MVMVDSCVLLDIFTEDEFWYSRSANTLEMYGETDELAINPIIYGEISVGFSRIEELERVLPAALFKRLPIPPEAAFLAGKAFLTYKKRDGGRRSPLPDFYIGAHAAILGIPLISRDVKRFRSYFPKLKIVEVW